MTFSRLLLKHDRSSLAFPYLLVLSPPPQPHRSEAAGSNNWFKNKKTNGDFMENLETLKQEQNYNNEKGLWLLNPSVLLWLDERSRMSFK